MSEYWSIADIEPIIRSILPTLVTDIPRKEDLPLTRIQSEQVPPWLRDAFLAPLAYTLLKACNPLIDAHLKDDYYAAVVRTERQDSVLQDVLDRFEAASLPVVMLKGGAIQPLAYCEPYHRFMSDLDLAIQPIALQWAWDAISPMGMVPSRPELVKSKHKGRLNGTPPVDQDGKIELRSPDFFDVQLDVHTTIFPGFWVRELGTLDEDDIWQRRVPLELGERSLYRLSNEDLVLHSIVHMAVNHQFDRFTLRNLIDIMRLHHKQSLDWALIAERAIAWRVSVPVWLTLHLLIDLFAPPDNKPVPRPSQQIDFEPLIAARDRLAPSAQRQRRLLTFVSPDTVLNLEVLRLSYRRFLFLPLLAEQSSDILKLGRQLPHAFRNRTGT